MKKIAVLLIVLAMSMGSFACGSKEVANELTTTSEVVEDANTEAESTEIESIEVQSTEVQSTETTEESVTVEGIMFEDNFAVDNETVAKFGVKVKEAVAAKDIEKLASLVSFPTYVGFDEGIVVETKADFVSLDQGKLFTEDMLASIAGADETTLLACRAGFILQTEGMAPSITYCVVEGELGIVGINY